MVASEGMPSATWRRGKKKREKKKRKKKVSGRKAKKRVVVVKSFGYRGIDEPVLPNQPFYPNELIFVAIA